MDWAIDGWGFFLLSGLIYICQHLLASDLGQMAVVLHVHIGVPDVQAKL